jgi:hypothetical protein
MERARKAFQSAYMFSVRSQEGRTLMPVRALVRLAELYLEMSPGDCLSYLDLAIQHDPVIANRPGDFQPFDEGEGAVYMFRIASLYAEMCLRTPIRREEIAARCFRRAIELARENGRAVDEAHTLEALGTFFEHLDRVPPRQADLVGAVACQVRAAEILSLSETGAAAAPRQVLQVRLRPRMSPQDFENAVADASRRANEIIEAGLARLEEPAA